MRKYCHVMSAAVMLSKPCDLLLMRGEFETSKLIGPHEVLDFP